MDWDYKSAYRNMVWWQCSGHEGVMRMYDDSTREALRRKYAEQHMVTDAEKAETAALHRRIKQAILMSGGDAVHDSEYSYKGERKVQPSIAADYLAYAEKQHKQDGVFTVPGSNAGVQVNDNGTLSYVNCGYLDEKTAYEVAVIAEQVAKLLHAEKSMSTVTGISPVIEQQYRRLKRR